MAAPCGSEVPSAGAREAVTRLFAEHNGALIRFLRAHVRSVAHVDPVFEIGSDERYPERTTLAGAARDQRVGAACKGTGKGADALDPMS